MPQSGQPGYPNNYQPNPNNNYQGQGGAYGQQQYSQSQQYPGNYQYQNQGNPGYQQQGGWNNPPQGPAMAGNEQLQPNYQQPPVQPQQQSGQASGAAGKTKGIFKSFSKKGLIIIATSVLLLLALVGGSAFLFLTLSNQEPVKVGEQNLTLRDSEADYQILWWLPDLPEHKVAVYKDIIDKFESQYSNVEIKMVNRKYDQTSYYFDITEAMAKGAGPDIFSIRNDDLPAYKDYMTPISLFKDNLLTSYKTDFVDLVSEDTIFGDQVYATTLYVDNLQMYYNKDILNQKGISQPAKTWEDLDYQYDDIKKEKSGLFDPALISLGTGGLLKEQTGRSPYIEYHQDIVPMILMQYGANIYDYKTSKSLLKTSNNSTSDPLYEAIKFYLTFSNPYSKRYTWNEKMGNNIDEFVQGRVAYIFGYKSTEKTLQEKNPNLNYGVTDMPQKDSNNKVTIGKFFVNGMSYNLSKEENNDKRYWSELFLYYLTTKEAQDIYAAKTNMPSARREVVANQSKSEQSIKVFADGALYAKNYYKPNVLTTEGIWSKLIEDIYFSNATLEEAVGDLINKYGNIVKTDPQTRRYEE